ncbi:MAG: ankyrin repeat domain-containing protein [Gemmatimonadetes bacterium]|nr:ankyrin repeat domain-containing protein [Gemmatimonadota bacterium]MBK7784638.1 ankyrin repeat domain-containing protein [Gemmatimonadota bacterium]MBK7925594.1 ankyrin repeat domain-containing protein [Gemmatimonadota bacterium]
MSRTLTPHSRLEHFTREAKRWLKALRAGSTDARARLARALEHLPTAPTLRDIQHALAREFGLPGWTALREALATRPAADPSEATLISRFLDNACPDHHVRGHADFRRARHTALRLLDRFPDLAGATLQTEIVCGDLDAVREALAEQPELARRRAGEPGPGRGGVGQSGDLYRDLGPKGWEPLLYLCYARLPLPAAEANAVAIATALLDAGADPNAYFPAGDCRYTALVGVMGEGEEDRPPHPAREALARLLLWRGADPYDNQVIYNLHLDGRVLWWLELIHERTVALGRGADWDDPEWPFLDMGGYGSGARWHLDIAIKHHDLPLATWCLAHGANPNAAPARSTMFPQYSLYETAVRAGATDIAELLAQHGATVGPVRLDPVGALASAAMRLDRAEAARLVAGTPRLRSVHHPIFHAAEANRADAVEVLLDAGISPDIEGPRGFRPLHAAAYRNALDVVRLLLARGAAVDAVEHAHGGTPLGHAVYAGHEAMIDLLAGHSRDLGRLVFVGKVERVRQLLAEHPELGKAGGGGESALMWLPTDNEANALELARLLLAHGADPGARNRDGQTAADRAESVGMYDLARVLREAAAGTSRPTQADYDEKVAALLEAYHTGTPRAMERHWRQTWHRRAWEGMRRYVQLDLGRQEGDADLEADLTVDDARYLVAREYGFEGWAALTAFTAQPPRAGMVLAKPMGLGRVGEGGDLELVAPEREWDRVRDRLVTESFSGLGGHGQLTDALLAELPRVESLQMLDLSGCRGVTDRGLRSLAALPGLRRLNLSGTPITDAGLAVLRELPALQVLELGSTRVTDAGMTHLAACDGLVHLDLTGTATGDGAIAALAGKSRLRRFHSGRGVTDAGLALLHQVPGFRTWHDEPRRMELLSPVAQPNHLVLRGTFTDRGLATLVGLDGLYSLNVDDPGLAITGAGLAPLRALPHLEWLACQADDATMLTIAALPALRFLSVQDTATGDDGWVALSRSRTLERIWGRHCPNLGNRGFRALAELPALAGLSVNCRHVDDDTLALLPRFPALRELMPMDIPDEGYRHIGRCETLESVVLMYCRDTGDRATGHLAGMPRLRRYFASYTRITDRTPELLSRVEALEEVEFSSCAGLTDAGLTHPARLPRLRSLKVSGGRRVTGSFAGAFGDGVRVRHSSW